MDQKPIIANDQLSSLRELSMPGEKDFVSELIDIFFQQSPKIIAELEAGVNSNDAQVIEKMAHKFKGSCGNIGAARLQALCAELEQIGKAKELSKAKVLFSLIPQNYREVCEVLKRDWYKA
jgi:HPt (histidine-containing phosphotransfer) domain-containing protein